LDHEKSHILSFITLDGAMQAPGGPTEDTSGAFKHGGWTVAYFDESSGDVMTEQMSRPFDLLLGRKTCENFRLLLAKSQRRKRPRGLRHQR
jgi:hypothetical protein